MLLYQVRIVCVGRWGGGAAPVDETEARRAFRAIERRSVLMNESYRLAHATGT